MRKFLLVSTLMLAPYLAGPPAWAQDATAPLPSDSVASASAAPVAPPVTVNNNIPAAASAAPAAPPVTINNQQAPAAVNPPTNTTNTSTRVIERNTTTHLVPVETPAPDNTNWPLIGLVAAAVLLLLAFVVAMASGRETTTSRREVNRTIVRH